jgi:hypothetical protein
MEIRILGKWKSRPATTPDQGDWFKRRESRRVANAARRERGWITSVKLGIMKWISRLLMLIVLALGYMCLQSAEGPGRLLFVCYNLALLLLWGLHELQHPLDEKRKASDGKL